MKPCSPHSLTAFALACLASSCVAVSQRTESDAVVRARHFETRAGLCGLYFYRDEQEHGTEYTCFFVDEHRAGMSHGKTFNLVWLEPGKHSLVSRAAHASRVVLDAQAGELIFVRERLQVPSAGEHAEPLLELVDPALGRQAVQACDFATEAR